MSEFEKTVVSRLTSIETKAENYITWKHVLTGAAAGSVLLIGFGEWHQRRMANKVDEAVIAAAHAFEKSLDTRQAEIISAIAFSSSSPSAQGMPILAGGDLNYFDPKVATKIAEEWKVITNTAAQSGTMGVAIDSLFLQTESGAFVKAFEGFNEIEGK